MSPQSASEPELSSIRLAIQLQAEEDAKEEGRKQLMDEQDAASRALAAELYIQDEQETSCRARGEVAEKNGVIHTPALKGFDGGCIDWPGLTQPTNVNACLLL